MASKNQPGVITIVLEHAADLKRKDFILSKQDPYVILKCGCQEYTSKTARHGGKNPVWNETVKFEIVNETHAEITIMDEDEHSSDDLIGTCTIPFAKVRETGNEHMQIPVIYKRGKEKGFISVRLSYESKASKPSSSQPAAPSGPQTIGYALMPVMPGMAAGMPGAPMPGMPGMPYPAGTMFTAPPVIPATAVPSAQ